MRTLLTSVILAIISRFSSGEVRNINEHGITTSSTFSRPTSLKSIRCPHNFPFAFKSGERCCRHQWKRSNFSDTFDDCDGFQINVYSDCCSDEDSVQCIHPITREVRRCRNYLTKKAVSPEMGIINKESVYLIDLESECTARLEDFPEAGRHHKAATIFQDKLLVCGGRDSTTNEDQSDCYIANEDVTEWTPMGSSYPTRGANLITLDANTDQERVVMAGGVVGPPRYDVPMGYGNGSPWTFLDPNFRLPTDEYLADFCFVQTAENRFFMTGHRSSYNASDPSGWINEADVYEEGQGWRKVTDIPWGGSGRDTNVAVSCALTSKGEVMVLGGLTNQVFLFNPVTETWKRIADMQSECNGPGMLNVDGKMYVFGSCGTAGPAQGDQVYVLERSGYWRKLENLQLPYTAHHTTVLPVREDFFSDINC